ncbi:MAG: hypothetical protein JKY50_19795 [Oleispira sp.]|nr:hypothetical protein [Oleispira sp.]MBL4880261.1 hypothetical protein [Oleispira sp.]
MRSKNMEDTFMKDALMKGALGDDKKQASEQWFDLITQITLDYRRSKDSRLHIQSKAQTVLAERSDALAV